MEAPRFFHSTILVSLTVTMYSFKAVLADEYLKYFQAVLHLTLSPGHETFCGPN